MIVFLSLYSLILTNGEVTNFKSYLIRDDEKFILNDISFPIKERISILDKQKKEKLEKQNWKNIKKTVATKHRK